MWTQDTLGCHQYLANKTNTLNQQDKVSVTRSSSSVAYNFMHLNYVSGADSRDEALKKPYINIGLGTLRSLSISHFVLFETKQKLYRLNFF